MTASVANGKPPTNKALFRFTVPVPVIMAASREGRVTCGTDRNNPDPALRTRSLTGLVILSYSGFSGGNKWTGGKIYDPSNGKTYSCNLQLKTNGVLEVRGYIGVSSLAVPNGGQELSKLRGSRHCRTSE